MIAYLKEVYLFNRKKINVILILTLISSGATALSTVMLIPALSVLEISSDSSGVLAVIVGLLKNYAKWQQVCILLGIYVTCGVIRAILSAKVSVLETEMAEGYQRSLRVQFYQAISAASWETFKSYKKTDLYNYFMNETFRISRVVLTLIAAGVLIINLCINLIVALYINVPMTIIVVILGIGALFLFRAIRKKSKAYGTQLQKISEHFFEEATTQMEGIKEIRSYGVETKQEQIFTSAAKEYEQANIYYTRLMAKPRLVLGIGSSIIVSLVFLIAYFSLNMSIARIAVLVYVFGRLWPSVSSVQGYVQQVLSILPVYENMNKVLENLNAHKVKEKTNSHLSFNKDITFKGMSFSYADAEDDNDLIEHVSFSLQKNNITALIGKSGAGKSTIVDIILGFLLPAGGEIYVDGKKISKEDWSSLKKNVSYIPQEPILLNASVRENLERFHGSVSEEALVDALKKAQIWNVVENLPNGLDTPIGDRGIRLSGGERQRIVLARALLEKPNILVLDEATSSLDYENERKIRDILVELKGELTVILVAHRLSTIQSADHILVIEDGCISEEGSYNELIKNKDGYLGRMLN